MAKKKKLFAFSRGLLGHSRNNTGHRQSLQRRRRYFHSVREFQPIICVRKILAPSSCAKSAHNCNICTKYNALIYTLLTKTVLDAGRLFLLQYGHPLGKQRSQRLSHSKMDAGNTIKPDARRSLLCLRKLKLRTRLR